MPNKRPTPKPGDLTAVDAVTGMPARPLRRASKPRAAAVVMDAAAFNASRGGALPLGGSAAVPRAAALPSDLLRSLPGAFAPGARQFGAYEMVAPLDVGGTAEVMLALRQTVEGFCQCVAVKALRAEYKQDPVVRHMFFAEARLGATLAHPNIVHTLDLGEQDGVPFVVTEYLAGQPLHRVLERSVRSGVPLDVRLCITIAVDVLEALSYVHELTDFDGAPFGIVHHDISPHNVFLTYRGGVKLLDFGIAWVSAFSPADTHQGLMGRPAYMAPEVIQGGRIDGRADVFSLGVVLWEILAGGRLFAAKGREETFARVVAGVVPRLAGHRRGVPDALDQVLRRALAVSPQQRFHSARQMRDALLTVRAAMPDADPTLSERRALEKCMMHLFSAEQAAAAALVAARLPTLRQRHVDFPVTAKPLPLRPRSTRRAGGSGRRWA